MNDSVNQRQAFVPLILKTMAGVIRAEIKKAGVISFSEFMSLVLYHPKIGYYEQNREVVGCRGDFITSVSIGGLFGELLAFQFAEWLEELPESKPLQLRIVEAGAHDGKLAADILGWLNRLRPELFSKILYCIIEPSPQRQSWQKETLTKFEGKIEWADSLNSLKGYVDPTSWEPNLNGILFCNELLDAFPVKRFGWDAKVKKWFEWGVALDGEKFVWTKLQLRWDVEQSDAIRTYAIPYLPVSFLDVLPDGYTIETSPDAKCWWNHAAGVLRHGKLVAIDYGFWAEEQFSPSRLNGTLRAYHRHRVTDDILANPGEQDLTAHVNFSAIQSAGEEAGLKMEMLCTQPQFLTRILQKGMAEKPFASLDAKQLRQFQTLTHPEHLGRAFRVLVQSR